MKSLLKEMAKRFNEIEEELQGNQDEIDANNDGDISAADFALLRKKKEEEDLEEHSGTGAVAGFNTPAAFAKPGKWKGKQARYESTKQPKHDVSEIMDKKYEQLIESYRAYALADGKSTPESKIKHTIKEVARQLQEIERTVQYASKLKTESGIARKGYGPAVESSLSKISERLIKISERVRALGE